MLNEFLCSRKNGEFQNENSNMKDVIDNYSYHEISKIYESEEKFQNSKIIIVGYYKENKTKNEELYFVIGFEQTILVIHQSQFNILQTFLKKKEKLEICFLPDTKEIFDEISSKEKETKKSKNQIKTTMILKQNQQNHQL